MIFIFCTNFWWIFTNFTLFWCKVSVWPSVSLSACWWDMARGTGRAQQAGAGARLSDREWPHVMSQMANLANVWMTLFWYCLTVRLACCVSGSQNAHLHCDGACQGDQWKLHHQAVPTAHKRWGNTQADQLHLKSKLKKDSIIQWTNMKYMSNQSYI